MNPLRSLRLAHLADTHLGYRAAGGSDPETGRNQRSVDIERAFETAIDEIVQRGVDLAIHAGDVFHHTRPSWSALGCFIRQMRKLEQAKIPTVVIAGNHDTPRLRTTGSVYGVLTWALPDIHFVAGYTVEELDFDALDLTVHAVPHGALTNPEPPLVMPIPNRRNIMVTHGLAPGVTLRGGWQHEPGEESLPGTLLDREYDYTALGHFHVRGPQGHNAWYSGSTERMGWGDQEVTPSFSIVELGEPGTPPEVEYVDLPARSMYTLTPIVADGRDARTLADLILDRLATLRDPTAMVRVELRDTPRPVRREVETTLRREAAELVWSVRVYAPADILAGFERGASDSVLPDLRTLFIEFVDESIASNTFDAIFATAFRARGERALEEAILLTEAAVAEDADA